MHQESDSNINLPIDNIVTYNTEQDSQSLITLNDEAFSENPVHQDSINQTLQQPNSPATDSGIIKSDIILNSNNIPNVVKLNESQNNNQKGNLNLITH